MDPGFGQDGRRASQLHASAGVWMEKMASLNAHAETPHAQTGSMAPNIDMLHTSSRSIPVVNKVHNGCCFHVGIFMVRFVLKSWS